MRSADPAELLARNSVHPQPASNGVGLETSLQVDSIVKETVVPCVFVGRASESSSCSALQRCYKQDITQATPVRSAAQLAAARCVGETPRQVEPIKTAQPAIAEPCPHFSITYESDVGFAQASESALITPSASFRHAHRLHTLQLLLLKNRFKTLCHRHMGCMRFVLCLGCK